MKRYLTPLIVALQLSGFSQNQSVTPGIRLGATYGSIDGTAKTLIRDEWYPDDSYRTDAPMRLRALVGGYLDLDLFELATKGANKDWLRLEVSVDYEHSWGPSKKEPEDFENTDNFDFEYEDWFDGNTSNSADSLRYRLWFNYSYINLGAILNMQFIGTDNFRLGPSLGFAFGFNVSPKNITYRSNHPDLGPDLQIQENITSVLRGGTAAWLIGGIGAQVGDHVDIAARFRLGLNDLVITEANAYNFIDNKNNSPRSIFFSVGFRIGEERSTQK